MAHIAIGALLLLAGIVATVWSQSSAGPLGSYTIYYGLMLVGAIEIVIGIAHAAKEGDDEAAADFHDTGMRVLFRSMIGIAAVDGALTPDKRAFIQRVAESRYGHPFPEEDIDGTYEELRADRSGLTQELRASAHRVTPEDGDLAIRSMFTIASMGGGPSEAAKQHIISWGNALNIGNERFQRSVADARARLAAA
jgi:hypothetical protein